MHHTPTKKPTILTLTTTLLLLIIALATPAHAGPDFWTVFNNRNRCAAKSLDTITAIYKLCNVNFVTGSAYAFEGGVYKGARAGVSKECKGNGQFVPTVWCEAQMLEVCALGDRNGHGRRVYNGGCQGFFITHP